jgi:hypothetical protein
MIGRGIIFSNPLAAAIRAGRKTQTRRLAGAIRGARPQRSEWARVLPGERLWVKEQWTRHIPALGGGFAYGSDPLFEGFQGDHPRGWKPARFMPFAACRTILVLDAVRIEPLHDITDEDAVAEGVQRSDDPDRYPWSVPGLPGTASETPREAFAALWDEIHSRHDWDSNPDVVVLTFHVEPGQAAA